MFSKVEFLTTHATTAQIERLIIDARDRLVLISPYLRWSPLLYERLVEADRRSVHTVFVYGKAELHADQRALLARLTHLSLYFCPHLHAKCYFNEQALVLASLNLLEFSEKHNREMGVLFPRSHPVYREAVKEAHSIVEASTLELGPPAILYSRPGQGTATASRHGSSAAVLREGVCIRCRSNIPYSPAAPYCRTCYPSWAYWGNPSFQEKACHRCGAATQSTMMQPLCAACAA